MSSNNKPSWRVHQPFHYLLYIYVDNQFVGTMTLTPSTLNTSNKGSCWPLKHSHSSSSLLEKNHLWPTMSWYHYLIKNLENTTMMWNHLHCWYLDHYLLWTKIHYPLIEREWNLNQPQHTLSYRPHRKNTTTLFFLEKPL